MKFQLNGERDTKALAKDAWEVQCLDQEMELIVQILIKID